MKLRCNNAKSNAFWIVTYHHKYGTDVWPVYQAEDPDIDTTVEGIKAWNPEDYMPHVERGEDRFETGDEWVETTGPFTFHTPEQARASEERKGQ